MLIRFFRAVSATAVALLLISLFTGCDNHKNSASGDEGSSLQTPMLNSSIRPEELVVKQQPNTLVDTVLYENGLLTISVRGAFQGDVLRRVARLAQFRFESFRVEQRPLDISLTRVPLEDALRIILGDTPYKLGYEDAAPGPLRKVSYLRVGIPDSSSEADLAMIAHRKAELAKQGVHANNRIEENVTVEQLNMLTDSERIERLSRVAPSRENMPVLIGILRNDRQPEMKIAAIAALENSSAPEALAALQASLEESNVAVVLAAIDSLEFAGDNAQIPALAKLLQHQNPDVRKAAAEAIDFLR